MRIGLDVRYLSHALVGGVQIYVKHFVTALMNNAADHELFLYADSKSSFEIPLLPSNTTLRLLPWHSSLSTIQNDFFLWRAMAKDRVTVAHFTGNYGFAPSTVRTVVTLQDEINLLPLREIWRGHAKNLQTMAKMSYLHFVTLASVRRADLVITVSDYSRRQIIRWGKLSPERVTPVWHGCPLDIQRVTRRETLAEVRQRLGILRPFVLAEAFKNPGVIVRAWRALPQEVRESHEIVFFSRSADVLEVVREAESAGWARLLVRPQRSDLSALYTMAVAFAFPSWIEGFGIPLVEAMACGAPIVCSDRGAIPEVVGPAALVTDADDDTLLAQHLLTLIQNVAERQRLRQLGLARAALFDWNEAARKALRLYAEVARG
jgi:glycosyltransferase involved in cell wall biosynthesis